MVSVGMSGVLRDRAGTIRAAYEPHPVPRGYELCHMNGFRCAWRVFFSVVLHPHRHRPVVLGISFSWLRGVGVVSAGFGCGLSLVKRGKIRSLGALTCAIFEGWM